MKKRTKLAALLTVLLTPVIAIGVADSADQLIALGMQPSISAYIKRALAYVSTSGDLTLPVASGKALSITVAGTEKAAVSSTGVFTGNGLNIPVANWEAVAGAGTTVADAAALSATKHIHQLTGANGTLGWKFASPGVGSVEILQNTTAGIAKIYAESGGTVNGGSADAAFSALTGVKPIICICTATATWICS